MIHSLLGTFRMKPSQLGRATLILVCSFFSIFIASANGIEDSPGSEREITGYVQDAQGEPVIGASIRVKGTTVGTITDVSGRYTVKATNESTLVISFVGYRTEEVKVGNHNTIDIILQEDSELIDEVVVIGYGTAKKKDLTGAAANIKGDKVAERRTTQLATALQGAVSGVLVTRSSGEPGAGASNILVRGVTTIGDSSPLIVVDGIPVDNINDVNANDVESITVLKDAASASIYGSRAAAGVILVTTKRATEKDLRISYNFEYGIEIPTAQPKQVDFQRYLEMVNELKYNDNPAGGLYTVYTEDQVNNWVKNNKADPDNYPITDWYDLLIKGAAPRQTHTLNLVGGSKNVKTRASLSYEKVDGLYKDAENYYERYMARLNNDLTFSKYLAASLDLNVKYAKNHEPMFSDVWNSLLVASPAYAWRWEHGGLADVKGGNNLYGRLVEGGYNETYSTKIGGRVSIDFTPFKDLKISAVLAPDFSISKGKKFQKKAGFTSQDDPTTIIGTFAGCGSTKLTEKRADSCSLTTQFIANYMKKFGKHDFNIMLGYENYYYHHETMSASSDHYDLDSYPYLDAGPKDYLANSGSAYENAYRSFFGRVMYSFNHRYLLQVNVRRDGSSRFHKDSRWGTFPSVSAGWIISEEPFMEKINGKALSFLKLRASIGTLGNERIGNYPYVSLMEFTNSLFYNKADASESTYYKGAAQIQYPIRNLTWETTETYDIGVDARFFDGRLSFVGDYYYKRTKDMLLDLEIPKYMGYSNPSQNAGKMHTRGYDLELSWNDRIGEFTYGISANLSDYISKMDDLSGTQFMGDRVKMTGSLFDEWYGYISEGLFQTQEELDKSATLNSNTQVGDVKYKDISGPDGVPDGIISPEYDRVLLGNSQPRFMYGGTLSAAYKGFDFSTAFQGIGKQKVRMHSKMVQPYHNQWGSIPAIIDGNYWSSFNSEKENLSASYPRLTYQNNDSNNAMSTFWIFNGSYFRLKNITLGYTLPASLTQKAKIERVRFYVSANDLFCLSHYPDGWDPERGATSYAMTTSVLFGLNINF